MYQLIFKLTKADHLKVKKPFMSEKKQKFKINYENEQIMKKTYNETNYFNTKLGLILKRV